MQLHPLTWLHRASRHPIDTTAEQEVILRRAAEIANQSLEAFILHSACTAAELAILDQRQFYVSGHERQQLIHLQTRPALPSPGLSKLLALNTPWDAHSALLAPQALNKDHLLSSFDCGKRMLNDWLVHRARQAQALRSAKTFVVCVQQRVIAYFSLSVGQVDSQDIPRGHVHTDDFPVPVVLLTRLAVDNLYQGKGIGQALLLEAIRHTLAIADKAGVEALLTQPINEKAAQFYQERGFTTSPAAYKQLILMVKDVELGMETLPAQKENASTA
jgi:uncharacterized protein (DUF1778 family)/GNAT superfamily N-acetyltransferase